MYTQALPCNHLSIIITKKPLLHILANHGRQRTNHQFRRNGLAVVVNGYKIVSKRIHKYIRQGSRTTSVKSVRVSVNDSLGAGKACRSRVAVSVIDSAGAVHARSVGGLVKNGGGLVLAVARPSQGSELVEEGGAISDKVGRWESVGKDAGGASAVDVGAVGTGHAASGGTAVVGDSTEAGGDGAADGRGGALEELVELGG